MVTSNQDIAPVNSPTELTEIFMQPWIAHITCYYSREANQLVEEFMLLANMAVAKTVAAAFPDRGLLRRHPPPQQRTLVAATNYVKSMVRYFVSSIAFPVESEKLLEKHNCKDTFAEVLSSDVSMPTVKLSNT